MSASRKERPPSIYTGRKSPTTAAADTRAPSASQKHDASHQSVARSRKGLLRIGRTKAALAVGVVSLTIVVGYLYYAATRGPAFYRERLEVDATTAQADGYRFEQSVADLHNDLRLEESWTLVMDEDEFNAWLATHLPRKLPHALPPQVSNPRVMLSSDACRLAFQTQLFGATIVVDAEAELFLSAEPNVLGLRINHVRSGVLPLPISRWTDSFTRQAAQSGIKVRWTQESGHPIALITVPDAIDEFPNYRIRLRAVEHHEGRLRISGTVERLD